MTEERTGPDTFDRIIGNLHDLPDVQAARPSTVTSVMPMLGRSQTFVVQTYQQREVGDFVFLQMVDAEGRARIVIPPKVADAIARQRDALTTATRRASGRTGGAAAQDKRRAEGKPLPFRRRK